MRTTMRAEEHFLAYSIRTSLIVLGVILFLNVLGFPLTFGSSVVTVFALAVFLLSLVFLRDRVGRSFTTVEAISSGLLIGLVAGVGLALVTWLFARLQAQGMQVHAVFAQVLPRHTGALTRLTEGEVLAGANVMPGLLRLVLALTAGGLIGGILTRLLTEQARARLRPFVTTGLAYWAILALPFFCLAAFLALRLPGVQIGGSQENIIGLVLLFAFIAFALIAWRQVNPGPHQWVLGVLLLLVIVLLPLPRLRLIDSFQAVVLSRVAIFVIVGLGLQIVIGYAGLLALGYAAFFAIGAYGYGLLSAPASYVVLNVPGFGGVNFWTGLPIAIALGAATGILLGIPVLRLRGDYLAIVTLGFGEIVRLLFLNMRGYTGGPGGVLNIPPPYILGRSLGSPYGILYLAMFFGAITALIAHRLRDSRIGRAWIAIREDEDVAQAMGINLVSVKLLAFAIGAAFAGLGGIIYASQQVNIFPDNFTLLVSIDVLSLVIIGGLGSIEGTILGSLALIGMPEILRGVNEYRIVAFGALLMIMMIMRPEGLLPSARRQRELHVEDRAQDAWLKQQTPAETGD